MDCDWIFLNKNGANEEATLSEPATPVPGDGKWNKSKSYTVRYVVQGRTTSPNPAVIATEN